ncbi:unnamed protein product [Periconia digitata]|uniref:Choline monooxygenase, chloroplastic n=1 Tax=Periconia digitata TaxID=1303443 RepID=A0A9W4UQZ4_9PLEO|nr:unnamed protein product [Periconia digitata]
MLHYFNFSKATPPANESPDATQAPVRALPASWYTSTDMYNFERRAIFSKRWIFLTHSSRLAETGDWLRYTIAGYDIILTKDREGTINAFHNVCRHRAYPVVEGEEKGKAKILACRYHGWSYGLNGKLAKAPGYQQFNDFKKEENGLLRIHVKIDVNGFVWINMDANNPPTVSWESHFKSVDIQSRYKGYDFSEYTLSHTYSLPGPYNWKILADNFNECYHCPTTHPDIPSFLNLESFDSALKDGHIQHHCAPTKEQEEKGLQVHSTYYFPASSMVLSRHFIMIQKFLPVSATESAMSYEVFRNKHSSDEDFHLIADMYERVMREDKVLCAAAQKNLERGVFVNGQLHPRYEKAPLFFQSTVRDVLREHREQEKKAGREIWPAKMVVGQGKEGSEEDEEFCRGLSCGDDGKGLEW